MEETHHQATSATCPRCAQTLRQLRVGRNRSGSQRYLCSFCQRKYTPHPQVHGYDAALRRQAIEWYVDGMNLRRIARHLGVVHQTVANWVAAYAATVPDAPPLPPRDPQQPLLPVVELDELYTFEGQKNSGSTSSPR
jgi:transposase-like protein